MKLKNSWYSAFLLTGFTFVAVLLSYLLGQLNDYRIKSKESEIENVLTTYEFAQKNYFRNFSKFSEKAESIGFFYNSPRVKLYTAQAQVPNDIRKYLKDSELPVISGEHYQILGIFDHEDKISIWIQNDVEGKKRLKVIQK